MIQEDKEENGADTQAQILQIVMMMMMMMTTDNRKA
jgi:hypothetical protein